MFILKHEYFFFFDGAEGGGDRASSLTRYKNLIKIKLVM